MNVLLKRVVQRVILLVSSFILQIGVISFFLLKYSESFFDFYLASLTLSIIIVFIIWEFIGRSTSNGANKKCIYYIRAIWRNSK